MVHFAEQLDVAQDWTPPYSDEASFSNASQQKGSNRDYQGECYLGEDTYFEGGRDDRNNDPPPNLDLNKRSDGPSRFTSQPSMPTTKDNDSLGLSSTTKGFTHQDSFVWITRGLGLHRPEPVSTLAAHMEAFLQCLLEVISHREEAASTLITLQAVVDMVPLQVVVDMVPLQVVVDMVLPQVADKVTLQVEDAVLLRMEEEVELLPVVPEVLVVLPVEINGTHQTLGGTFLDITQLQWGPMFIHHSMPIRSPTIWGQMH